MFHVAARMNLSIASALVIPMGCFDNNSDDRAENIVAQHEDTDLDTDTATLSCEFEIPSNFCENTHHDGLIQLADAQNFYFKPRLNVTHTVIRGNSEDFSIDWSGLTVDMYGRKMNPSEDVGSVSVILCHESQASLLDMLSTQTFSTSGSFWILAYPSENRTSVSLSEFWLDAGCGSADPIKDYMPLFNPDDPAYDPEQYTHMVTVQSGVYPGYDLRAVAFFTLDSNVSTNTVTVSSDGTRIDYACNVRNQELIPMPHGDADITVSWKELTQPALGWELGYDVYAVSVVHVSWDACELEENILRLADEIGVDGEWYRKDLEAASYEISLSELVENTTGERFNGIDDTGTWMIMLHNDTPDFGTMGPGFLGILHGCEQ